MIKRLRKQRGFGLVEVIIALGLLGVIGIAFLGALATASNAIIVSDKRTTAESLARSEMEYVKSQDYIDYSMDPHDVYDTLSSQSDYSIETSVEPFNPDGGGSENGVYNEYGGVFEQDDGIQLITVTVIFIPENKEIIELKGYKTG